MTATHDAPNDAPDDDRTATETADDVPFGQAAAAARALSRFEFTDLADLTDYVMPYDGRDGAVEVLAWAMHPSAEIMWSAAESDRLDDEDGAAPLGPRTDRTFLFDAAFEAADGEDADLAFEVVAEWTNSYDDERVTIETPAPWDVPDDADVEAPNEVIKSLPWGEDDAEGDREGAHYTFEDDDRHAPEAARDSTWTLDADYLADLREAAQAAGYEWVDATGPGSNEREFTGDETTIEDLARFAQAGDRVTVRYQKKNGSGRNVYAGEVDSTMTRGVAGHPAACYGEAGVLFADADGKHKRVRVDDGGDAGLFSSGHYPFMGAVESVEVEVADPEWA